MTDHAAPEATATLRAALGRAAVWMGAVGAVGASALAALGWAVDGVAGLQGAAIGVVLAVAFFAVTAVVAAVTAGSDPVVLAAALLGSWLAKVVVAVLVLVLVRDAGVAEPVWVAAGVLLGLVLSLTVQVRLLMRARVAYLEPDRPRTVTDP